MLFLIDYENVGNAGMKGSDCLNTQDHVIVFYSEAKKHMEQRALEAVSGSGCTFEICKLCKTGKNALDFYIATRLGELFGEGYEGIAVIVSNDGGFQAVRDYWEKRAAHKRKVVLSNCIEDGIVSGNENNERTRELRRLREKLAIGGYYSAYTERMRIKTVLREIFEGTQYESKIEEIQNMLDGKEKNSKIIYLDSLHLFGRKGGLEVYNKIKACNELL
ncbi:MAG: NYN domain-containing protein [Lachnospiraceae bacterium]|nr:NYN domain-containing protein [Lachnospiraceae bacterium]